MVDKDGNFDGWEWLWGCSVAMLILMASVFVLIQAAAYFVTVFHNLF